MIVNLDHDPLQLFHMHRFQNKKVEQWSQADISHFLFYPFDFLQVFPFTLE